VVQGLHGAFGPRSGREVDAGHVPIGHLDGSSRAGHDDDVELVACRLHDATGTTWASSSFRSAGSSRPTTSSWDDRDRLVRVVALVFCTTPLSRIAALVTVRPELVAADLT
jgi:hypothetical protein